jgi:nucleoporin GLE1
LQKAVNIPVNAISPVSADHLQDKLLRLSRLISGQPVEVGHGQVIASSHPEGIAFCKNLLAKKFVVSMLVTMNIG